MNSILKIIIFISFFILLVHYNNSHFIFQYNTFYLKIDSILFVFTLIAALYFIVKISNRIFLIRNIDNAKLSALINEVIKADYSSESNNKKISKIFEKNKKILSFYGYYQNLKDLLDFKLILSEDNNQSLNSFCNEIAIGNKKYDILISKVLFEYIKDNESTVSREHYQILIHLLKNVNIYDKKDKYEATVLFLFAILHNEKDINYEEFFSKICESVKYIIQSKIFYSKKMLYISNYKAINQKYVIFLAFYSMIKLITENDLMNEKINYFSTNKTIDIKFALRILKDMMNVMKKSFFDEQSNNEILNLIASTILISEKFFLRSNQKKKYFNLLKDYITNCSRFFNYNIVFQYIRYCSILNIDNSSNNSSFHFLTRFFSNDYKYKILICYLILDNSAIKNCFKKEDLWKELLSKKSIDSDDIKFLLQILHKS
ncbi:hypothetical protein GUI12_02595 [Anaplasmataceae bacterium AB001_6]|nr:hypothetical protein GUI12_02595 [Anaplasmataceae bacterium AB001_6]